ncbi:hypothetical protein KJ780_02010, partial [Candidatus Micrarchaeota archaeon]|nr:hypothetical protein [Candidatus Micrarchaeota archaeon]
YRKEQAIRSGLLMLAVGEFSLIIAQQANSLVVPFDLISITASLVFFTALIATIAIRFEKQIVKIASSFVPVRVRNNGKEISLYLAQVVKEFEAQGSIYNAFARESRRLVFNCVLLILIALLVALISNIFTDYLQEYLNYVYIGAVFLAIVPTISIVISINKLLRSFSRAFHSAMGNNLSLDDLAMRDTGLAVLMLAIAAIVPLMMNLLSLPAVFGMLFIVPLGLSVLFMRNLASLVKAMMDKKSAVQYERRKHRLLQYYAGLIGIIKSININGKRSYYRRNK